MKRFFIISMLAPLVWCSCNSQSAKTEKAALTSKQTAQKKFTEGVDYQVYERVRLLDRVGFTEPQEAYSILLPKGWKQQGDIMWNQPGSSCAGTFRKLTASSADGSYRLDMLPDLVFVWNTNPQLSQFNHGSGGGSFCQTRQPVKAEEYLRNIFAAEIGNPQVMEVEPNPYVVEQMRQQNEPTMRELQQYGAGQMQFDQTAVNARVKWTDGTEGLVTLGVNILETIVPNIYDGTSSKIYTTQITKRTVFKYPARQNESAKNQFSMIMASFRTNPAWNDAVNRFWKEARQQSNRVHVGRITLMDEQTRKMGEQAIRNGQERSKNMDVQMRNWEQKQNAQDRMHTEFIKTIREVENFRDETGKYEMSSGYEHAWSRGDGTSFILSNSPSFDPSSVFQDQNWKQMKKVQ